MLKGLCFSLPSISINNTLTPLVKELSSNGYQMIYYNTGEFNSGRDCGFEFRVYEDYNDGYSTSSFNRDISYFRFGEILADTAGNLMDFLIMEIEREKPDFILHSHLALWGKLMGRYFELPSVSMLSTFIMDPRIMVPFFRKLNHGRNISLSNINVGKRLQQKLQCIYDRLGFTDQPDIWDTYVNKEELNLLFNLKDFQPNKEIFGSDYQFVGPPVGVTEFTEDGITHDLIYLSLGTIFNQGEGFYHMCLNVLSELNIKSVLSIGKKNKIENFGTVADTIEIREFTNQAEILKSTAVFITHGGLVSVHEAVLTLTPMLVIPQTPEQTLAVSNVEALGLGIVLNADKLTDEILMSSIQQILTNNKWYINNLKKVRSGIDLSVPTKGFRVLEDYLKLKIGVEDSFEVKLINK